VRLRNVILDSPPHTGFRRHVVHQVFISEAEHFVDSMHSVMTWVSSSMLQMTVSSFRHSQHAGRFGLRHAVFDSNLPKPLAHVRTTTIRYELFLSDLKYIGTNCTCQGLMFVCRCLDNDSAISGVRLECHNVSCLHTSASRSEHYVFTKVVTVSQLLTS